MQMVLWMSIHAIFKCPVALHCVDILLKVVTAGGLTPCRPLLPPELPEMPELREIIAQCWVEFPQDRPSIDEISKRLRRHNNYRSDVVNDIGVAPNVP